VVQELHPGAFPITIEKCVPEQTIEESPLDYGVVTKYDQEKVPEYQNKYLTKTLNQTLEKCPTTLWGSALTRPRSSA
jgi:hypothetical protein